jgi:long-chain acyl-CoA synthetase
VLSSFRQGVGGRVRFCVSGAAPLDPDLGHLFRAAGMPVLEGYGLTETTGPAAVNTPSELRIGSVGRPLPGVEIELADDGELRVRGPSVIGGYHDDPERTAEVLDEEGWFRTGDLGRIDDDGYIEVTDRKKALIVTANGETVAPEPLERRIRSHPLVSHAMVVGDGQPFVAAVVTLDPDELRRFAAERRLPDDSADRLRDRGEVRAEVQGAVDRANERVSRAESVRELRILGRDLSEEAGELSHTMDLRRPVVAEHFAEEIESIYDRSG